MSGLVGKRGELAEQVEHYRQELQRLAEQLLRPAARSGQAFDPESGIEQLGKDPSGGPRVPRDVTHRQLRRG